MFKNLRAEMVRKDIDVPRLAEMIGMKVSALYARLNGSTALSFADARNIKQALGVDMTLEELFEEKSESAQ